MYLLTKVTWTTIMPPPLKPPSQHIRKLRQRKANSSSSRLVKFIVRTTAVIAKDHNAPYVHNTRPLRAGFLGIMPIGGVR
jgi:hypothetical protein